MYAGPGHSRLKEYEVYYVVLRIAQDSLSYTALLYRVPSLAGCPAALGGVARSMYCG